MISPSLPNIHFVHFIRFPYETGSLYPLFYLDKYCDLPFFGDGSKLGWRRLKLGWRVMTDPLVWAQSLTDFTWTVGWEKFFFFTDGVLDMVERLNGLKGPMKGLLVDLKVEETKENKGQVDMKGKTG